MGTMGYRYLVVPVFRSMSVKWLVQRYPQLFLHANPSETAPWFTAELESPEWILIDFNFDEFNDEIGEPNDSNCGCGPEIAISRLIPGEIMPTPLIAAYSAVAYWLMRRGFLFQTQATMCRQSPDSEILVFGKSFDKSYEGMPHFCFRPFPGDDSRIGIAAQQTWSAPGTLIRPR